MREDGHFDDDGRLTSKLYGDIYFSGDGVSETEHVFVSGNDLVERFKATTSTFVIGETGFGTGLNFLVAAQCFSRHAPAGARLVFVSTEQHPLATEVLEAAHAQLPETLQGQARKLRIALAEESKQHSHHATFAEGRISLHVLLGDATESLRNHSFTADAWFLDGFSPARNPAMWSFELLREVANQTACNGTAATYTVAGQVRRNLQDAGFNIERQPGFGKKREMLRGTRKVFASVGNAARLASATDKRLTRVQVHGAGIAGATIAHAFAERGVAVTVIDPHGVAAGASGIQAAIVRPRLWVAGPGSTPDAEIIAQAFRFTTDWLNKVGDGRFRQCGAMLCAADAEDEARLKQRCANPITSDLVSWLDSKGASECSGTNIPFGAAWIPTAGTCDLGGLCSDLLHHKNIRVCTEATDEPADLHVLATADATGDAGISIATQSIRGQAVAVDWDTALTNPSVVLCTSGYLSPPDDNGTAWIGSTFDRDDCNLDQREADDSRIHAHFVTLPDIARCLAKQPTIRRFTAIRTASNDRLPIVGPLKQPESIPSIASLAHGSRGAVTAPWAADLLVRSVFAEPLPISQDYWQRLRPSR